MYWIIIVLVAVVLFWYLPRVRGSRKRWQEWQHEERKGRRQALRSDQANSAALSVPEEANLGGTDRILQHPLLFAKDKVFNPRDLDKPG